MSKRLDLSGMRFGRLLAVELHSIRRKNEKSSSAYWRCTCDCGKEIITCVDNLSSGDSKSCGCLSRERIIAYSTVHGLRYKPEYNSWKSMRNRCLSSKHVAYKYYGGRGISVCERWINSFPNFLADMGPRPSPKHSIDRYPNNNGNYEPSNCRWATMKEQRANQRSRSLI